jgi:GntP family gluconate:H+ symporter
MVAAVIAFPSLVTGGIAKVEQIDADKALQQMMAPEPESGASAPAEPSASQPDTGGAAGPAADRAPAAEDDPMKALEESMKRDAAKKP